MVVGDEIQLGPRSCTFNVCSNESCKEEDFQISTSRAFFDCSELWTVSHFNSFILITYLISLILLSWNYASPLAFKAQIWKSRWQKQMCGVCSNSPQTPLFFNFYLYFSNP